MRLAMIDNYDSFTYNLVQYLGELGAQVEVFRNDAIGVEELLARRPHGVVISPGPGEPEAAGITVDTVLACARSSVPLLGVCLGHQAIGLAFGGRIVRARSIMHGKMSRDPARRARACFAGLENPFEATRYHSLVIEAESCPAVLAGHRAHGRRRDHGRAPPRAADRRRPVPPRVDPDARRQAAARALPRGLCARCGRMSLRAAVATAIEGREVPAPLLEAAFGEIMDGRGSEILCAALLVALRTKGETVGEIVAAARAARSRARQLALSGSARGRHLRHRRRRRRDLQHLDRRRLRGRGRGRAGRQARQPRGLQPRRQHRRARGARRERRAPGRGRGEAAGRGRHRAVLRARRAPGHARARAGARGARRAHADELPGPAAQPRRRALPAGRRVRGVAGGDARGGARASSAACARWSCTAATGSTRSPPPPTPTRPGWRRAACGGCGSSRSRSGSQPARPEELRGGDAAQNAAIVRAVLGGEPGPRRDIVLLNAAAALWVAGAADGLARGSRAGAPQPGRGRRGAASSRCSRRPRGARA